MRRVAKRKRKGRATKGKRVQIIEEARAMGRATATWGTSSRPFGLHPGQRLHQRIGRWKGKAWG